MTPRATLTVSREPGLMRLKTIARSEHEIEAYAVKSTFVISSDATQMTLHATNDAKPEYLKLSKDSKFFNRQSASEEVAITFYGSSTLELDHLPFDELSFDWPVSSHPFSRMPVSAIKSGSLSILSTGKKYDLKRGYGLHLSGVKTQWFSMSSKSDFVVDGILTVDDVRVSYPGLPPRSVNPTILQWILAHGEAQAVWSLLTGYFAILAILYAGLSKFLEPESGDRRA